jgi:hypothetical protein
MAFKIQPKWPHSKATALPDLAGDQTTNGKRKMTKDTKRAMGMAMAMH